MNRQQPQRQEPALLGRLSSYAAAAGLGAFSCGQDAQAGIVYVDVPDQSTTLGDPTLEIDLNNDSTADLSLFIETSFGTNANARILPYNNPTGTNILSTFQTTPTNAGYYIQAFAPGDTIDGSAHQSSAYGIAGGRRSGLYFYNFVNTGNYVGFQWDMGGTLHYGWLEVDLTGNPSGGDDPGTLTLKGYAYETEPETAIVAGERPEVPEPTTLALLAAGGGALALASRRRDDLD